MNSPSQSPSASQDGLQWDVPIAKLPSYFPFLCIAALVIVYRWISWNRTIKDLPYVNTGGLFSTKEARRRFLFGAEGLVNFAREKYPRQPWRLMTDLGERIVLPPELMEELRNEPNMSFKSGLSEDFHGSLSGFDVVQFFTRSDFLIAVIRKHLLRPSPSMTKRLCDEAEFALSKFVGNSSDWNELELSSFLAAMSSRMSTRIFSGEKLCRNEEWLEATRHFHHSWFAGAVKLHDWPRPLRHLVHWLLPECQTMRASLKKQRQILADHVAKRREIKQAAIAAGQEPPKYDDGFEWAEEETKARGLNYDDTVASGLQLTIALVSSHATTDLLQKSMIDLLLHPAATEQIREEVVQQLRAEGMSTSSFYNMKLLDSALKETQRLTPSEMLLIRRRVMGDVRLSNGLVLKEGMRTWMDTSQMRDPTIYENPEQWDASRFAKLRSQPGGASSAQLVSSTRNHVGFGYGQHACTGRFFAVNLIKVLLCRLLVEYEWKLAPGADVSFLKFGNAMVTNPAAKILIRRRQNVEFDFSSI